MLEQLRAWGLAISSGQLNNILIHGHERFDQEQEALLLSAKLHSPSLQVDDTGTRHNGENGYATFIENEWFSYFKSTESKSRIHFLELLPGAPSYLLNEQGCHYLTEQSPAPKYLTAIAAIKDQWFTDRPSFQAALETAGIHQPYAVKTITEAALLGALMEKGMAKDMVLLSDDAGQFTILTHALCWITCRKKPAKDPYLYPLPAANARSATHGFSGNFINHSKPTQNTLIPPPESTSKPILITSPTGKPNGSP